MAGSFASASSQYLYANSAPVTAVPLTMACWFNVANITANHTLIYVGSQSVNTQHAWLLRAAGGVGRDPVQMISRGTGSSEASTSSGYSASTWHHACGVTSANDNRVAYIDGGNSGTNTNTQTTTGVDRIAIGATADSIPDSFADGLIAEVGVWTAALDAEEIAALAKGFTPDQIRPSALVFYAPLVRTLTRDLWGGLTLTNGGGVTVAAHPRIIEPMRRGVRKAAAVAAARRQRLPLLGVG